MRSNKLKHRSLELRKVYCRAEQGELGSSCAKIQTPQWFFGGRVFKGKTGGEGCRVCDLPLIGWWGGNLVVPQESEASAFWFPPLWGLRACADPKSPSSPWVGPPGPAEELRDLYQIVK